MHAITMLSPNHDLKEQASTIAESLSIDVVEPENMHHIEDNAYMLTLTPDYLGLIKPHDKHFKPFYINFLSGKMSYRIDQAGLRKEALAKALGCHPKEGLQIVDTTAGLGRDSYILASLGFNVTLLERSGILHAMLKDAMTRAEQSPSAIESIRRMRLIHTDAIAWLENQAYTSQPDVIYLDPMFPERKKSASVKKEMVILQDLLGNDNDREKLLSTALLHAKKRVVVKLPKNASTIGENRPNFDIIGRSCRFDIYLV